MDNIILFDMSMVLEKCYLMDLNCKYLCIIVDKKFYYKFFKVILRWFIMGIIFVNFNFWDWLEIDIYFYSINFMLLLILESRLWFVRFYCDKFMIDWVIRFNLKCFL